MIIIIIIILINFIDFLNSIIILVYLLTSFFIQVEMSSSLKKNDKNWPMKTKGYHSIYDLQVHWKVLQTHMVQV